MLFSLNETGAILPTFLELHRKSCTCFNQQQQRPSRSENALPLCANSVVRVVLFLIKQRCTKGIIMNYEIDSYMRKQHLFLSYSLNHQIFYKTYCQRCFTPLCLRSTDFSMLSKPKSVELRNIFLLLLHQPQFLWLQYVTLVIGCCMNGVPSVKPP